MYRRNIAAAAAILILAAATGLSAYAAPKETEETETVEREAGFIPIEEMPIEETESEAEEEQTNTENPEENEIQEETENG